MRTNRQRSLWLSISILSISILAALCLSPVLLGQALPHSEAPVPATSDWSQHHVIFSRPGTAEQVKRVERDPRYWQQLARHAPARLPNAATASALASNASTRAVKSNLKRDWSQNLGTGASVGAGNYPAKFSFDSTTANCTNDFVVYSTGLFASASQASIVAYNNLYSGCPGPGTVPSVYWAYDTASKILTSPVFSADGKQVAYVETNGAAAANLVLLKWAASSTETVGAPQLLLRTTRALYTGCTAPCFTSSALRNAANSAADDDTTSSVFYDYEDDVAYVGDSAGVLHKFTPVFRGALAEVTAGWPVQVSTGPTPLTSPVYDSGSGNVFVEDNGGFLYSVDSITGAVTQSLQLDFSVDFDGGPGFVQGPVLDTTAGLLYVFVPSDGNGGCAGGSDCSGVFQFATNFGAGQAGLETAVGASTIEPATPNPLYIGAFDSTYESSVNATGHLYVCGNTGGPPILYQVLIQGGVLGTVLPGPPLSTGTSTPCSPVTDVLNPNTSGGATEFMFASAQNSGPSSACSAGGCIFNFMNTSWIPANAYAVGQEVLDSNLHVEVVVSATGPSGATTPTWTTVLGGTTPDGSVHWLDQGPASAFTPLAWQAAHHYTKGTTILDPAGNIELVTTANNVARSGGTIPAFSTTPGGTVVDGSGSTTLIWTNVGAIATAALPATGGTSGIIIDNIVGAGTQPGASQIYFSTLGSQTCGTSGTGGCAVQASQSALK
jgi:hypothetical protein